MNPQTLIAQNLHALPHPDGTPRQLPGFSTQLLPEALQQEVTKTANEIAESIIHLLELHGFHIVTEEQLSQPTPTPEKPAIANIHCTLCDQRLLQINITKPEHVLTNGPQFIEALTQRNPNCPHT